MSEYCKIAAKIITIRYRKKFASATEAKQTVKSNQSVS